MERKEIGFDYEMPQNVDQAKYIVFLMEDTCKAGFNLHMPIMCWCPLLQANQCSGLQLNVNGQLSALVDANAFESGEFEANGYCCKG